MKNNYIITTENGIRLIKDKKMIKQIENLFELSDYEYRCKEELRKNLIYFLINKIGKLDIGVYSLKMQGNTGNKFIEVTNRLENKVKYENPVANFNFYNSKAFSDIFDEMIDSYGTQIEEDKLINLDYVYAVFKENIEGYSGECFFKTKNVDFVGFYSSEFEAEKIVPINLKIKDNVPYGTISFYIKLEKKFIKDFINRKGLFKYFNSILFFNMIEDFENHYELLYKKQRTIDSILAYNLYSYCKTKNVDFTGFKIVKETITDKEKIIKIETIKHLNEINSTKENLEKIIAEMLIDTENIKPLEELEMNYHDYNLYLTDIIKKFDFSNYFKGTDVNLILKIRLKIKDEILNYFQEKKSD